MRRTTTAYSAELRSIFNAQELLGLQEIVRKVPLGDHVYESLLTSKRIEWEGYRSFITDYELNRYLAIL